MNQKITRRRFLRTAAVATSGLAVGSNVLTGANSKNDSDRFAFVLLGDLHLDKLEHHDLPALRATDAKQLPHIEMYSRITAEMTPKLFSTVRKTIVELNKKPATRVPFTIQVGDLLQGVCRNPELSQQHYKYALDFVRQSNLGTPFLFTKGNHEINEPSGSKLYRSDIIPFLSEQIRAVDHRNEALQTAHFAVSHGNALFVFFDAYNRKDCLTWMESILAKRTEQHLFIVIHPPATPYGARAAWHIFSNSTDAASRERFLNLLGRHRAMVLSGHLHKFSSMVRDTKEGKFFQLALHSVIPSEDVTSKATLVGTKNYTPKLLDLDPEYSPETREVRREWIETEKPFVRHFEYADLPGYAVVTIDRDKVEAKVFSGISRKPWKTINVTKLLAG